MFHRCVARFGMEPEKLTFPPCVELFRRFLVPVLPPGNRHPFQQADQEKQEPGPEGDGQYGHKDPVRGEGVLRPDQEDARPTLAPSHSAITARGRCRWRRFSFPKKRRAGRVGNGPCGRSAMNWPPWTKQTNHVRIRRASPPPCYDHREEGDQGDDQDLGQQVVSEPEDEQGATAMIGTVWVPTRRGYRPLFNQGESSITMASSQPAAIPAAKPRAASFNVGPVWRRTRGMSAAKVRRMSLGAGRSHFSTPVSRTPPSHRINRRRRIAAGGPIVRRCLCH